MRYYYVSYVGSGELVTPEKITAKNHKEILIAMKADIEKNSDYTEVVILTFQELKQ